MIDYDFTGYSKLFFRDGSGNTEYICYRDPVQAAKIKSKGTDKPIYAIKKIAYTAGAADSIEFVRDADGNISHSEIADDRASLTYT